MNLDGGDYHPLFAQRSTIGFAQMTEVVELADKNFAAIFSDQTRPTARARSPSSIARVGPDQHLDRPDRLHRRSRRHRLARAELLPALAALPRRAATGHTAAGNAGAYRSPAPLPNGQLLVSYAANATDLANFSRQLRPLPRRSGLDHGHEDPGHERRRHRRALGGGGLPALEPRRLPSRADEPNGHTRVYAQAKTAIIRRPSPTSPFSTRRSSAGSSSRTRARGSTTSRPDARSPTDRARRVRRSAADQRHGRRSPAMDAYGTFYARRRKLGTVPLFGDGSARMVVPGRRPDRAARRLRSRRRRRGRALPARGDAVLPRRIRAPGFPAGLLQRPVRRLPRLGERLRDRPLGAARHPDASLERPCAKPRHARHRLAAGGIAARVGPVD